MSLFIYSHNENSEGAKLLARELTAKRIKHEKSSFIGSSDKTVINWGAQKVPNQVLKCKIINDPGNIARNSNKLKFFQSMDQDGGPRIPPYTDDPEVAQEWWEDDIRVVSRTILNGSSGDGIFISTDEVEPKSAPLYTQYIKKKDEYRVHIVNGEIIDFQRKALRPGVGVGDGQRWLVRNLMNGFIYVRGQVELPEDVKTQSLKSYALSGLDFGAFDVIWNDKQKQAYVLEVNTAPGLIGTTLTKYAEAFKKHYNGATNVANGETN